MNPGPFAKWLILSLLAVLVFVGGMILLNRPQGVSSPRKTAELEVWCAAALKSPMEELALGYERAYGTKIQLQYGGSGTLLAGIETTRRGDLFIPADDSFTDILRKKDLGAESIPLVTLHPALAVAKGNPKNIKGWQDLLDREDVRLGLCNPESAAIGRKIKEIADSRSAWARMQSRSVVSKTTVTELANDLLAGALDATFLWDQTVKSMPGLEVVPCAELANQAAMVSCNVLRSTASPAGALHFARWIASPEHGTPVFRSHGFAAEGGDIWQETPEMLLFSGGVNRPAVEAVLKEFCEREGAVVKTVYNGCGILCATMQTATEDSNALPDAYYACDICFVPPVAHLFPEAVRLTETDIVIAVPAGNPAGLRTLADLAKPGLRVGACDTRQSALGFLTERLLDRNALGKAVGERIVSRTPTADLLVNQLRAGALDAAVVYRANVASLGDAVGIVPIDHPAAKAVQPYAVAANSRHRQLSQRLLVKLMANQRTMLQAGFRLIHDPRPVPSKAFDSPGFEKQ